MQELRTTREVAEALGVLETRIENTIRRREIARPPVIGGVRLWSREAVEEIQAVIRERDTRRLVRRAARARATGSREILPGNAEVVDDLLCACGRLAPLVRQTDEDLVVEFVRCLCGNFAPAEDEGVSR